jgi:hypothetical protein
VLYIRLKSGVPKWVAEGVGVVPGEIHMPHVFGGIKQVYVIWLHCTTKCTCYVVSISQGFCLAVVLREM